MPKKKSRKQRKIENVNKALKRINDIVLHKEKIPTPTCGDYIVMPDSHVINNDKPKQTTTIPDTYIVAPAIKLNETGEIFSHGYTCHAEIKGYMMETGAVFRISTTPHTEGFLDNHGNFYDRREAGEIAYNAGQLMDEYEQRTCLYSYGFKHIIP